MIFAHQIDRNFIMFRIEGWTSGSGIKHKLKILDGSKFLNLVNFSTYTHQPLNPFLLYPQTQLMH